MYGELQQHDGQASLVFTRRLPHPPEKVWRALVEPEHLAVWFPTDIEGEREGGAALRFVFRNGEGPTIEGTMLRFEPPRCLEMQWGNEETLRFGLAPDGDGTVLTFVNTFAELGKAARDAAGWHTCLDVMEHDLRGEKPPWTTRERWNEVHPEYVRRFGPEATTVGVPASNPDYT